jgi:RNA polymerase sigma factor (sigma-70 family)
MIQMDIFEFKIKIYENKDKLYRFARRMLRLREEAEDVVQEVFVKLWQRMDELDTMQNFDAYAMVVTKNLCIDRLRSKKVQIFELDEDKHNNNGINPEKIYELSESKEKVTLLIDELPEKLKMVMHLRDIEGMENDEIAEVMGIEKNDVKVTLCRARKKVREKLLGIYQYEKNEY